MPKSKTVEIKIPDDIEFRVISNALGILIASAGLIGGEMVYLRSFDYWRDDIVPLLLLIWMSFRLFRNFLSTMNAYQGALPLAPAPVRVNNEQMAAIQIPSRPKYTPEQVVEEVAKRIEAQKAGATKRGKPSR